MIGRVRGDTLSRIWTTFGARGHARDVAPWLDAPLLEQLERGRLNQRSWYPIDHYLALYGTLRRLKGHEEVVATACDSVTRALRGGSWSVFVPIVAKTAPEMLCQQGIKRLAVVWRATFDTGEATGTSMGRGAGDALVTGVPWSADEGWRGNVEGGLMAIPTYVGFKCTCRSVDAGDGAVRFELRWGEGLATGRDGRR
jgi:hypothetical protein